MALYKSYQLCQGDIVQEALPTGNPFVTTYINFVGVPSFVILENGAAPNTYSGWEINTNTADSGSYSFSFQETTLSGNIQWQVNIVVGQCGIVNYTSCCNNQINLAWLNRQGGWQNYIFTGIKTFEVQQNSSDLFKTFNKVAKYSEKTNVYNAVIATTGNIPKSHVDYLDSLRYSIQAFMFNEVTNAFDIPIVLDSEDFTKYTSRQKLFDITIRFIYSTELIIQSQ
jgi:hypothetical protein